MLRLTDDREPLSSWQVCDAIYRNTCRNVVLHSTLADHDWPHKFLHLALETMWQHPMSAASLTSLSVSTHTARSLVDCDRHLVCKIETGRSAAIPSSNNSPCCARKPPMRSRYGFAMRW